MLKAAFCDLKKKHSQVMKNKKMIAVQMIKFEYDLLLKNIAIPFSKEVFKP